jgi:hypothetical protein
MRRWPEFRQPLFVGAIGLYGAYRLSRYAFHLPFPALVTAHLADLLAMPVFLTLALATQRCLGRYPPTWTFPDPWLLAAWAYVALVFEVLLPHFSAHAVGDWRDVIAYALGTLAFRYWLNQPVPPTS